MSPGRAKQETNVSTTKIDPRFLRDVKLTASVLPIGTQVFLIHATDALAVPVEAATVVGFTIDQNNDVTYSCRKIGRASCRERV